MTTHDDDELDRLLARGRLSGPARDRIFARAAGAATPRARRWRGALTLTLPAAAAALVLLLWPRHAFTPKGEPAASFLDVTCVDGAHDRCKSGATLLFHVGGVDAGGQLAAWAEPAGGGGRIWYAPTEDGRTLEVAATPTIQTLAHGVRLGPEQPPGSYVIHLVLATRPLSRSEALAASRGENILAATTVAMEVTP